MSAADVEPARGWLLDQLRRAAVAVYPETEPLVERDSGPVPAAPEAPHRPTGELCYLTVSTVAERPPRNARQAVERARAALVEAGWRVGELGRLGERFEVPADRDGFVVKVAMSPAEEVLRLSGQTPVLPPAVTTATTAAGPGGGWAPANDTERVMWDALVRGDREAYLALVATRELYLPAGGGGRAEWITTTIDGRAYLLVFTSPDALRRGAGDQAGGYRSTTAAELVASWPEPAWRLAVDHTTPVAAYLSCNDIYPYIEAARNS